MYGPEKTSQLIGKFELFLIFLVNNEYDFQFF